MKKKRVPIFALTFLFVMFSAFPAIADYQLDSANIEATCEDYSIIVTGSTDQTDHEIQYELSLYPTVGDPIVVSGSFVVNGVFDESHTFSWPIDLVLECESYHIEAHIYMPCRYHLYPETDLDCPCNGDGCETELVAGQHWDAGVVTISNDDVNLYVTFETANDWELGETHLYVGTALPSRSAPGRFPYKDQIAYIIPLSDLGDDGVSCGDRLYIAAHAVVTRGCQEETAWADSYGIPFGRGWAMYVEYEVCSGCIEPE